MKTKYSLRKELLQCVSGLKNKDYQMNCWVRNQCPANVQHDEFKLTINFLFDDTLFAENPRHYLGTELHSDKEVESIKALCTEIDHLLNDLGTNKDDLEYINSPKWDQVISQAEKAYQLLSASG